MPSKIWNSGSPRICNVLSDFIKFKFDSGLSERTIEGKSIQLTSFLNYVKESGINKISLLEAESILPYVKYISQKSYSMSTRSGILFTLRVWIQASSIGYLQHEFIIEWQVIKLNNLFCLCPQIYLHVKVYF